MYPLTIMVEELFTAQYWFYPNPGNASYTSPKALVLLVVCAGLIVASFVLKKWRTKQHNPVTRKLSKSWPSACSWFGVLGIIMIVSRVELISYLSTRFLWVIWFVCLFLYIFFQWKSFKARHYEVVKKEKIYDPRDKYLPGK